MSDRKTFKQGLTLKKIKKNKKIRPVPAHVIVMNSFIKLVPSVLGSGS